MKKYIFTILVLFIVFLSACGSSTIEDNINSINGKTTSDSSKTELSDHFSGVWVTNVGSPVMYTRDAIHECVSTCKKYHIGNIFMCVWNKGQTLYPSDLMEKETGVRQFKDFIGRDPLKEMIEEAHKEGIKVHAWFEYGFASGNGSVGPLLTTHPEWASCDVSGKPLIKNNFHWMNPFKPEVQQFMISLIKEVIVNYDIDGVQGDDRMPALPVEGGYDEYTKNLYKQENGKTPPTNNKESSWVNWRCNKLSLFQARLFTELKSLKKSVIVSSAPSIYPWGKIEYLQDWPTWLKEGSVDYVIPQIYRTDLSNYRNTVAQQAMAVNSTLRRKVYIGLMIKNGDYYPTTSFLRNMIEANRANSICGECFWYYDGLKACDEFFKTYK